MLVTAHYCRRPHLILEVPFDFLTNVLINETGGKKCIQVIDVQLQHLITATFNFTNSFLPLYSLRIL